MVCSVHPFGVEGNSCLDFRANPDIEVEDELWMPAGTRFVERELLYGTDEPYQRWTLLGAVGNTGHAPDVYGEMSQL